MRWRTGLYFTLFLYGFYLWLSISTPVQASPYIDPLPGPSSWDNSCWGRNSVLTDPTITPSATGQPFFKTSTPVNYTCMKSTPIGWGTVTPDLNWIGACEQCVNPATPTNEPLVVQTCTSPQFYGTPDSTTVAGCEIILNATIQAESLTQTAYPTITNTPGTMEWLSSFYSNTSPSHWGDWDGISHWRFIIPEVENGHHLEAIYFKIPANPARVFMGSYYNGNGSVFYNSGGGIWNWGTGWNRIYYDHNNNNNQVLEQEALGLQSLGIDSITNEVDLYSQTWGGFGNGDPYDISVGFNQGSLPDKIIAQYAWFDYPETFTTTPELTSTATQESYCNIVLPVQPTEDYHKYLPVPIILGTSACVDIGSQGSNTFTTPLPSTNLCFTPVAFGQATLPLTDIVVDYDAVIMALLFIKILEAVTRT